MAGGIFTVAHKNFLLACYRFDLLCKYCKDLDGVRGGTSAGRCEMVMQVQPRAFTRSQKRSSMSTVTPEVHSSRMAYRGRW